MPVVRVPTRKRIKRNRQASGTGVNLRDVVGEPAPDKWRGDFAACGARVACSASPPGASPRRFLEHRRKAGNRERAEI